MRPEAEAELAAAAAADIGEEEMVVSAAAAAEAIASTVIATVQPAASAEDLEAGLTPALQEVPDLAVRSSITWEH